MLEILAGVALVVPNGDSSCHAYDPKTNSWSSRNRDGINCDTAPAIEFEMAPIIILRHCRGYGVVQSEVAASVHPKLGLVVTGGWNTRKKMFSTLDCFSFIHVRNE